MVSRVKPSNCFTRLGILVLPSIFDTSLSSLMAPCGLRGCKNWPAPFPGRMSYKTTKLGLALSVVYLGMFYCSVYYRAPFYVSIVFVAMCSVFWLFWLSCHYLPSDWLERLLWRSLIVVRGSSPESPGRKCAWFSWFIVLLHCLLCICVVSCPYAIYYPTVMARYSLFVLKVPLNPKQTNKQTNTVLSSRCGRIWWSMQSYFSL